MSTTSRTSTEPGRSRWFWLLPALTFLFGLVLGGLFVWVGDLGTDDDDGDDDVVAESVETASEPPTQTGTPDRTVTVPGSCVEAAERSQEVLALMDDVASAARDLDAQRLQELVDELGAMEPQLRDSATECQEQGVDAGD